MKLTAYNFLLKKQTNDLHGTLFATLTLAGVTDYSPKKANRDRIQFCFDGSHIRSRVKNTPQPIIKYQEETLDVDTGDYVKGVVTLSNFKQCYIGGEAVIKREAELGKKLKYSESHPYRYLNDFEFHEYALKLLAQAGLEAHIHKKLSNPIGTIRMEVANKDLNALDIVFTGKITDLEKFEHAWYTGIGRAKTYGFGMLRVVKA